MKKIATIIICIIIAIILTPICLNYNKKNYPNEYYNVYLDDELLGTITSKEKLLSYIEENTQKMINISNVVKTYCEDEKTLQQIIEENNLQNIITNENSNYYTENDKQCVDINIQEGTTIEQIYTPLGLQIEKTLTYKNDVQSIEDIYSKIAEKKAFTIKGYQFTIHKEEKETIIYVVNKETFEQAVHSFIEVYVGEDEYQSYLTNSQTEIKTTGSILENIYIQESITVKEKQIPIDNKIYTDSKELTQFLVYGNNPVTKKYVVKQDEMIADIARNNEISSQEFLISNPKYKSENSLIAVGTEVNIKQTNPQLNVVVEKYLVEDQTTDYQTIYEYDETQYVGYQKTVQEGVEGLVRVKQRQQIINGLLVYATPKGKETLKSAVDEIVVKGDKIKPNVGDLNNWGWPSDSRGYNVSGYDWRIHPVTGERKFHEGIDIAGMGYNAPIYAANNGTVMSIVPQSSGSGYGNYIVINHNNGYYTLYGHMNKFVSGLKVGDTVLKGQLIGYVGSTGISTGPHIHFEVWKDCLHCHINPRSLY